MSKKKQQMPPQDPSDKIFDTMFEFKMMAKQMQKEAGRSEKQSKALVEKVKKCIAKNDYEQAKLAASDAIRQKNMVKRYRVLSSKIDTVAQRLKTAYQNQKLSEQMQTLTQQLLGAGNMMDQVFDNVNAGTVNENEVNQLIGQIAQQNGMKLSDEFEGVQLGEGAEAEKEANQQVGADGFPGL